MVVDVVMPQMGVSVSEGTILSWLKQVGDHVAYEEPICAISTDKIDVDVPSPAAGAVAELLVKVGETVAVGATLARIAGPANGKAPERAGATPVVARMATDLGVDLERVAGTGRNGRVTKRDLLAFVEQREPVLHGESPYWPESPPPPAPATYAPPASQPLSRMRAAIGANMKRSQAEAATCTNWMEVDMTGVERERRRLGLTALPFIAAAAVDALREHPTLNAWLEGDRHTLHQDVNLGVAVSLGDDGLVVPVILRAHELSVEGLAARIRTVAERARAQQLSPDDFAGGTFTISNAGRHGSLMATPIINQPQVAILGVEAIEKRPVVVADAIAIRDRTTLGLSWDHRALDGVAAASFIAAIRRRLEAVGA